jgi:arylsulfatase A-like enzyme
VAVACALALCALLPLAVGGSQALAAGGSRSAETAPDGRPNVLLIISDDQAWSTFSRRLMPSVYGQLVDRGVLFRRAYVNTSLCCPSRAQILTGLYEHNTGVDSNDVSLTRPTLPMALHDAGYHTMLAGKYLNSWPCTPRPEFDRWDCVATPELSSLSMIDPMVNADGQWQRFTGYETDILASMASNFIAQTPANQPFFVMYAPTSPHLPADDPRYADLPVSPPRGPAFNVNTMTPGTPQYSRRTPFSPDEIATSDSHYTAMAHATRSLDDAVDTLLSSLGDRSRDTLVVYLSDNGFLYGEHRRTGKTDPWEESVNVPMVVRYPAVLPADGAFESNALVQNVDIAATIADLLHLPWGADGRSFLPVLERKRSTVRTAALIEGCRGVSKGSLDCSGLGFNGGRVETPGFEGIVTQRYKYVEFDDGSVQLVDLKRDPHELRDLAGSSRRSGLQQSLAARLHAMMTSPLQTTIAAGPGPSLAARVAEFSYFSPSRFATYRCRLTRNGVAGSWRLCPGGFDAINDLSDGRYVFEVAGVSESGSVDPTPAHRAFTVASGGPGVSLVSHPKPSQTDSNASFTYASTARDVGFQCRLVSLSGRASWDLCDPAGATFSGLAEGTYLFEVRARTSADEVSNPAAGWFFRVDATGPTAQFSSAPPPATRSTHADFRFEADELTTGPMTCNLDGRTVGCVNGRLSLQHVSNGDHTLSVRATDLANNVGVTVYGWTVDRARPDVRIQTGPPVLSSNPTSVFNLSSSSDPGLFVCRLDDGPTMPCFTAPSLYGLKDGHHKLVVWSYDAAMNRSDPATYRWAIDTTAPTVKLVGGPAESSTQSSDASSFDVWQSEPGDLLCSLDGGAFASCRTSIRLAGLTSGPHTFEVYVVDRAGNRSDLATRSWTIA